MSKGKDREDKLAEVLDEAGVLAPLLKVAIDDVARTRGGVVWQSLRKSYPDLPDSEIDELVKVF